MPKENEKHDEQAGNNPGDVPTNGPLGQPDSDPENTETADVDSLLAAAADSLADLDEQLGEAPPAADDNTATNANAAEQKPADTSPDHKITRVDQTLENLQKDLNGLANQVNGDQLSNDLPPSDIPAAAADTTGTDPTPDDNNNSAGPGQTQLNNNETQEIINALPDLPHQDKPTNTHTGQDSSSASPDATQDSTNPNSSEQPSPDSPDSIDSVFAGLTDELKQIDDNKASSEPNNTGNTEKLTTTQIDQETTVAAIDSNPTDQDASNQTQIAAAPEPAGQHHKSQENSSQGSQAHLEAPLREDEQTLIEEIVTAESQKKPPQKKQPTPSDSSYADFSSPQRLFLQALETLNKPFNFVAEDTKDILAIVAVGTCLVTIITAAMILLRP